MRKMNKLVIKLDREEKNKLDDALEVMRGIHNELKDNKANGFTPWQEGVDIYDSFWQIYIICHDIDKEELIP